MAVCFENILFYLQKFNWLIDLVFETCRDSKFPVWEETLQIYLPFYYFESFNYFILHYHFLQNSLSYFLPYLPVTVSLKYLFIRFINYIFKHGNNYNICLRYKGQTVTVSFKSQMPKLRGAFNKFPDLFVQAFKIFVDSWKFRMLLIYILWDDWRSFMISGSNEQLQQQLEYILLKPDCHSWWISKIQSRREDTLEERYAIKFCYKLGKNATETYGMLQTAFGVSCMNRASV